MFAMGCVAAPRHASRTTGAVLVVGAVWLCTLWLGGKTELWGIPCIECRRRVTLRG